jgi:hypothetical protein
VGILALGAVLSIVLIADAAPTPRRTHAHARAQDSVIISELTITKPQVQLGHSFFQSPDGQSALLGEQSS